MTKPVKTAAKRRGSWFVTLPLLVVVAAYVWLLYLPGQRRIAELRQQIEQKRQFITSTTNMPSQIEAAEQKLAECQQYTEVWRQAAPDDKEIAGVYAAINERARLAGALMTRFDPQETASLASLRRVPVSLALTGDFRQIFATLSQLEQLPQTVWLEDIWLQSSAKTQGKLVCEVKLAIFADNPEKMN